MRKLLLFPLLVALSLGAAFGQASPFNLNIFKAQSFTATGQTGAAIQLNGLVIPTTVGSSYASGTITVTGVALTTVSFQVMGSSDNGSTFYLLPVSSVTTPGTPVTTVTATAPGLYQISLAGLTHVQLVTTGTFTATSVTFSLTGSPNASISRNNGSGGPTFTVPVSTPKLLTLDPWIDPRASAFGASCSNNPAIDDSSAISTALTAAQAAGLEVQISGTCYIQHPIIWPNTALTNDRGFGLRGAATGATIRAATSFPNTGTASALIYRQYSTNGPALPIKLHDIALDANATASACVTFEAQRQLFVTNVACYSATGNGGGEMNFGLTGGSALVGLTAREINIDNYAIVAALGAAARPSYGLYMNITSSDGDVSNVVANQNAVAGVYVNSGNNKFASIHPWGFSPLQVSVATWPEYGVFLDTHAFGNQFSNTQCDTVQLACFHAEKGFMNATNTVLECNDGGTGSQCQPFIVEAVSGASNIFLYGGIYQAGALTAPQSPINWLGTPDTATSQYLTQWGINQVTGRNGLHLGTGGNRTTIDETVTTGRASFLGGIQSNPASQATASANVFPATTTNAASIWNGSAATGAVWSLNRFTSISGIPTFDQLLWAAPQGSTYIGTGNRQFGIADTSTATSSNNYNPPDFIQSGACWNGTVSAAEGFFWRFNFGTGANPTETLNLFNTNNCSGVKSVSANFLWSINSLTAVSNIQSTSGIISAPIISSGAGTPGAPSITSSVDATSGFHFPLAGVVAIASGGFDQVLFQAGQTDFRSTNPLRWNSGGPSTSGNDTGISRSAAGVISVDTTTIGNGLGTLKAGGVTLGTGNSLSRYARFAVSLTPAAVAANTCVAQSFTVTGVLAGDFLIGVSKPTEQAGISTDNGHVSAANTATVNFCNNTAAPITPTAAETYQFVVVQ